ncbi:MAG: glycoside hydrolase family 3 N-terminal domain-containing protein, partial [Chitinophagaceae bacterium]
MSISIKKLLPLAIVVIAAFTVNGQTNSATDAIINQQIKKMTLEEKISLLHANGIFTTSGIKRLAIPGLSMDDGPLGIREDLDAGGGWASANLTTDSATFFPCGAALAATWNPGLATLFGKAMGEEARARNKDIMLAPAFNIARTPLNGR